MNTELLISGNTVSLVEKRIIHTTTLDAFKAEMTALAPITTGVLPMGCKAMYSKPSSSTCLYVIERQPGLTAVAFHREKGRDDTVKDYTISLPFIQFYVCLRKCEKGFAFLSLHLSCTKMPIMAETDAVHVFPFPNIFGNGENKVCTGMIKASMESPFEACNDIISSFFSAPGNLDLSMQYPRVLAKASSDDIYNHQKCLTEWQNRSEENALFGISKDINYRKFELHESVFNKRVEFIFARSGN